jgi:hypothetical protein
VVSKETMVSRSLLNVAGNCWGNCCKNMSKPWSHFALMQQCVPKMTLVHTVLQQWPRVMGIA